MGTSTRAPPRSAALIERRARLLGPTYRLFYDEPLELVRGEGVWLHDADGRRYLDMYNNVPCVGHCHPRVVRALAEAASTLNTHTRYLHSAILDLAEALLRTMPKEIGHVVFTCTGSEANDLAIRVAKAATGGTGVIVTESAYHGGTETTAGLSPEGGESGPLGPGVYTVPAPRPEAREADPAASFAEGVEGALARMRADGIRPAAILFDTIFASDGVYADPPGLVAGAVEAVRAAGGVYIADEVQPGFGRTGAMWGFERHRVPPDLVTMGKPMGNGHPVAAMAARPELLEAFARGSGYFNTFGGNPVSAAVAGAVLEVLREERLLENAAHQGAYLRDRLRSLAPRQPVRVDVRGAGLFLGAELGDGSNDPRASERRTRSLVNALRERYVLVGRTGRGGNVVKIRPPLPLRREDADFFLAAWDDALASAE
jgi:4-aminobutyrate aminotransferase-like enzyme